MVMIHWWLLAIWLVLAVGLLVVIKKNPTWLQSLRNKKSSQPDTRLIAHSQRFEQLPAYIASLRRFRRRVFGLKLSLFFVVIAAVVLSLQPNWYVVERPDEHNRDIMLCLDISGSMTKADSALAATYISISDGLKGERIGLSVFDSSSSIIFPLTSDYDYIKERLSTVKAQLNNEKNNFDVSQSIYLGTFEGQGSSLIGDGLASCVLGFDQTDVKRSRSIILATDNYTAGAQLVTLEQAASLAVEKNIRVYGINPSDFSSKYYTSKESTDYKTQVLRTEGNYYPIKLDSGNANQVVGDIVKKISEQEATRFRGTPQIIKNDVPLIPSLVLVVGFLGYCLIAWRIRE